MHACRPLSVFLTDFRRVIKPSHAQLIHLCCNSQLTNQVSISHGFIANIPMALFKNISNSSFGVVSSSDISDCETAAFTKDHGLSVTSKHRSKNKSKLDFRKIDVNVLPTVILIGRPNVGKSALFNRLIRRREALVYNTPDDHVTRDIRGGVAKLGDLRFKVLDSAGLETEATYGNILSRTADMTKSVLTKSHVALFLIDVRDGLQPLDLEVGKWLRKHASQLTVLLLMNKSESLDETSGLLTAAAGEAQLLGFGNPIAVSAETGLGMAELYESLYPLLERCIPQIYSDENCVIGNRDCSHGHEDAKVPLQLAILGRPNVGKSTLLNAILQKDRVIVGPEAGLTRDSIREKIEFEGQTVFLVDTAGWMQRAGQIKGPSSLGVLQSRKNLLRAHIVALVLDADEIAKSKCTMKHAEVVIARQVVEEGRGLVVVVNKMDILSMKEDVEFSDQFTKAVTKDVQTMVPQVVGVPVVFVSALKGEGRISVMHHILDAYKKWCLRLPTSLLNRWLQKEIHDRVWPDHLQLCHAPLTYDIVYCFIFSAF